MEFSEKTLVNRLTLLKMLKKFKSKVVPIPNNNINYFQPPDLIVNKSSKYFFLHQEAQS